MGNVSKKKKRMQHVHSKEHDINCIVFPQNDPWEHAAIQLRVRPTRPTLELSGQVAPPTTKRRLPTKFGRPGPVFACEIAKKIYIWKQIILYNIIWTNTYKQEIRHCILQVAGVYPKVLQTVEESLLEITWTVDYVWRLAMWQSRPLQVKLNHCRVLRLKLWRYCWSGSTA